MDNEQPLLTIGIPTWNRARELQGAIRAWITEIESVDEKVEIVVSDNASDDETKSIMLEISQQVPFLRYFRNETNLGPDLNFLQIFKQSNGQYIWLFSDDDFIEKGALAEVLRIIRSRHPSYISTNFAYCDYDGKIIQRQPQNECMIREDIPNADINRVFSQRNHWLSFMSCNIYRRDLMDIAQYEKNVAIVPSWIQVYVTAHVLSREPSGYLSSLCAVKARSGNSPSGPAVFAVFMPRAFVFICERFSMDRRVRIKLIRGIMSSFISFKAYVAREWSDIEVLSLGVPIHYKVARKIWPFRPLVRTAWRTKRFIAGEGFTLPW